MTHILNLILKISKLNTNCLQFFNLTFALLNNLNVMSLKSFNLLTFDLDLLSRQQLHGDLQEVALNLTILTIL